MKFLIGLLIVVGLCWGGWNLYEYWGNFKPKEAAPVVAPPTDTTGQNLPGMPPKLEPILEVSRKRGAVGLHDFLATYGNTIADPRRAWIELDYVVLLSQSSPGDARKQFAKVKTRVMQDSPVYSRVKQLEKTYE